MPKQEAMLKRYNWAVLAAALAPLSGCASMNEAGSSDVQLSVTPMTAMCEAHQQGVVVGQYDSSRQSINVPNSPGATDIVCFANGYKDKRITMVPDGPGVLRGLLVDFGPIDMPGYQTKIEIAMEPADKQGLPR
jgi:hypothetical protein